MIILLRNLSISQDYKVSWQSNMVMLIGRLFSLPGKFHKDQSIKCGGSQWGGKIVRGTRGDRTGRGK